MAKAHKKKPLAATPEGEKVRTRRRAGVLEFWDEKAGKWISRDVAPTLLDRLLTEDKIDESMFLSGLRFSNQFEQAGLGPKYGAIALTAVRVDGGKQWAEPIGGSASALEEITAALGYVGEGGPAARLESECLRWLIGYGEGIEEFSWRCRSNGLRIHDRSVQWVLCGALGTLDRFYRQERRHGEGR